MPSLRVAFEMARKVDRAEAAADRAASSGTGPSTVNNVTIDINCQAPPSKRLLTDYFSLQ